MAASPAKKTEQPAKIQEFCGLCSKHNASEEVASHYCLHCEDYLCETCVDHHRKIPILKSHALQTVVDRQNEPPKLLEEMSFWNTFDPSKTKDEYVSIITVDWFQQYYKYLFNPDKNPAPGPVEHYIEGNTPMTQYYYLPRQAAVQLRRFFGSNQEMPLRATANTKSGQHLYVVTTIDVKDFPGTAQDRQVKIVYSTEAITPACIRMFTEEGIEIPANQVQQQMANLFQQYQMNNADCFAVQYK